MEVFIIIGILLLIWAVADVFKSIAVGKRALPFVLNLLLDLFVVGFLPIFYIYFTGDWAAKEVCCDDHLFGIQHRITMYVWIGLCMLAYFFSVFRKQMAPPIIEVLANCFLLVGVLLNGLLTYHFLDSQPPICPIIMLLFLGTLARNQHLAFQNFENPNWNTQGPINQIAFKILRLNAFKQYPILILVFLPILIICTAILMLFGQQPDSTIKAFTETYRLGFSQIEEECFNVDCGGHYLCSVAAQGHPQIVQPQRLGIRHGKPIICNRQLLIANAFEELIEEHFPKVHTRIRHNYNKVGTLVHKHYYLFEYKYISDFVYLLMKPLEWFFWLVLYTFDRQPENRIAQQYLPWSERRAIKCSMQQSFAQGNQT